MLDFYEKIRFQASEKWTLYINSKNYTQISTGCEFLSNFQHSIYLLWGVLNLNSKYIKSILYSSRFSKDWKIVFHRTRKILCYIHSLYEKRFLWFSGINALMREKCANSKENTFELSSYRWLGTIGHILSSLLLLHLTTPISGCKVVVLNYSNSKHWWEILTWIENKCLYCLHILNIIFSLSNR